MLREEKWLGYALRTLQAVSKGACSITQVAEIVGGSESYLAKVIATLRKAGLINSQYELSQPLNVMPISAVLCILHPISNSDPLIEHITNIIINTIGISVEQVLKCNDSKLG